MTARHDKTGVRDLVFALLAKIEPRKIPPSLTRDRLVDVRESPFGRFHNDALSRRGLHLGAEARWSRSEPGTLTHAGHCRASEDKPDEVFVGDWFGRCYLAGASLAHRTRRLEK